MTERNIADPDKLIDTLVSLAKRRGFIFQSSEIYGGINAIYDFGPLGSRCGATSATCGGATPWTCATTSSGWRAR